MKSLLLNAAFYQIGWFACVLGGARGLGTQAALLAILLALVHLGLAERPRGEWPLMLVAAGTGLVVDSLHSAFGILDFTGHRAGAPAPIWIVALWLQFATTLHFSMRWLSRRYLLASALGLVGGPMAFLAGERLGAATFGEPKALSLALLGLAWAIALPALVALADRLGGAPRYRIFAVAPGRRPAPIATLPEPGSGHGVGPSARGSSGEGSA